MCSSRVANCHRSIGPLWAPTRPMLVRPSWRAMSLRRGRSGSLRRWHGGWRRSTRHGQDTRRSRRPPRAPVYDLKIQVIFMSSSMCPFAPSRHARRAPGRRQRGVALVLSHDLHTASPLAKRFGPRYEASRAWTPPDPWQLSTKAARPDVSAVPGAAGSPRCGRCCLPPRSCCSPSSCSARWHPAMRCRASSLFLRWR
jgi:hypothetical protein